jgi:hypothetical protein
VSAALRFGDINLINESWLVNPLSEIVALLVYIILVAYLLWDSMRAKK